jgi:hypothetical protein
MEISMSRLFIGNDLQQIGGDPSDLQTEDVPLSRVSELILDSPPEFRFLLKDKQIVEKFSGLLLREIPIAGHQKIAFMKPEDRYLEVTIAGGSEALLLKLHTKKR